MQSTTWSRRQIPAQLAFRVLFFSFLFMTGLVLGAVPSFVC